MSKFTFTVYIPYPVQYYSEEFDHTSMGFTLEEWESLTEKEKDAKKVLTQLGYLKKGFLILHKNITVFCRNFK